MVVRVPSPGPATVRIGSGPVGGGFVSSGGEGQDVVFGFHTASGDQGLHLEEKSESLGKETIAAASQAARPLEKKQ